MSFDHLINLAWGTIADVGGERILVRRGPTSWLVKGLFSSTKIELDLASGAQVETASPSLEVREIEANKIVKGDLVEIRGRRFVVNSKLELSSGNFRLDLKNANQNFDTKKN